MKVTVEEVGVTVEAVGVTVKEKEVGDVTCKKKIDFFRSREKTRVSIFSFGIFEKVDLSPEPFGARSEIHIIITIVCKD